MREKIFETNKAGGITQRELAARFLVSPLKPAQCKLLFAALEVEVCYLPPYSPDLNSIEMCRSKIKTYLKQAAARKYSGLSEEISKALKTITAADAGRVGSGIAAMCSNCLKSALG